MMLNCWLASNHKLSGYFCFLTKRYDGKNTTKHWLGDGGVHR